jgi:hypothetical protein
MRQQRPPPYSFQWDPVEAYRRRRCPLRSDRGTAGSIEKQNTTIARVNNMRKGRRKKDSPATKGGSCIHLPHSSQ